MKKNLLKSMLVAVGLLMGASVSAQTTTLMEYGTADAAWSATNLAEWTAGGNPTITDGCVEISGGNGSYATSKTIAPDANAVINVQAVWRAASSTGRTFAQGNGSYFRFGNIIVVQNDQNKLHGYGFTGLDNIASVTTFTAGSYRVDVTSSAWLLIDMEINTASNTLTSFSIKSEDGNTTYASASNIALSNADYTTVAFGYRKSGSVSTTNKEQLKSVKVTQTVQVVETADYTVKYICNGAEVKESATRTGVVGQDIVLNASDTENFYANDKKYIYVSSDVEGKTVAEGVVVTVTFREAEKFAWTAKSSVGNYTISGETFEGDKASVKYPLYVLVDGKLWTKAAIDKVFAQNFDVTENNQEFTLEYTETEIENVVFYTEMEDVEGMGVVDYGNAEARSSKRAAGYSASGNTKFATLPAGKYQMYASFYSPTSAGGNYKFYTGSREIWSQTTGNANVTDANTEIMVAHESNDILLGQTGYTAAVDYLYFVKIADLTGEEIAMILSADMLATAKDELAKGIAQATELNTYANDADLAAAINAAQGVVNNDAATLEDILAAGKVLEAAATTAAKATLQKVVVLANAFGMDTTAANAVLAKEDATVEELADALKAIAESAKAKVEELLPQAKSFLETFDATTAAALEDDFTALETALAGTDITAMVDAAQTLIGKIMPAAKVALEKIIDYLEVLDDETVAEDLVNLQTALNNNDLVTLLAVADKAKEDLTTAVPAFLADVKTVIDEGKAAGYEAVNALEEAYNNAQAAIIQYVMTVQFGGNGDIVAVGKAIYDLVLALRAYNVATGISEVNVAAQQGTVYNLRGQKVMKTQKGLYIINGKKVLR